MSTSTGRRAAVLGSPVAHSLSPALHNAAYRALGLVGWSYGRQECDVGGLAEFVDGCGPEWAGLSLTMPLKRVALDVAREVSELATALGAANTLLLPSRRADNTDAPGMVDALRAAGIVPAGLPRRGAAGGVAPPPPGTVTVEHAVILGAGGTARAALGALSVLGAGAITVLVRSPDRAGELLATAGRLGLAPAVAVPGDALPAADLVVSTLPKGAADRFALSPWPAGAALFDVVYDPWPTPLATAALRAGARVVSGLDLLLHQAARQVTAMTGRPAPLDAMAAALR